MPHSAKSAEDRQTHVSQHANDLCSVATVTFVQGVKHQSSSDVIILDRVFEFCPLFYAEARALGGHRETVGAPEIPTTGLCVKS